MATRGFSSGGLGSSSTSRNSSGQLAATRNIMPSVTSVGSQGGGGYRQPAASSAPSVVSTYRSGDYIYTQYSNGTFSKSYSPLNVARTNSSFGTGSQKQTVAQQARAQASLFPGQQGTLTGGSGMATPTGSYSGGDYGGTGGGQSTGGGSSVGSVTGGSNQSLNDSDVGKLFGWTKGMTETDVMRGLEYPMRILEQVMGGNGSVTNNPAFANFMNPLVSAMSNPNTQLLFNPQLGGTNTTTGSEGYNFIADMLKNFTTPGGALPDVGSALGRIASALGNNQSGIYNLLMQGASGSGAAQGNSGMGAYGAMFDALSSMLDPILSLGMSPLQSMITNSTLNNLMNSFMMNVNDNSENPLAYVMRGLGYPAQIAGMPSVQQGQNGASTGNNGSFATGGNYGQM